MDQVAFEAIKASIKEMDSNQLSELFSAVAEAKGIIVACAAYKEYFDDTLKENNKPPLTDDEWKMFREKLFEDDYVDSIRSRWWDARNGVMEEHIRQNWDNDEDNYQEADEEITVSE